MSETMSVNNTKHVTYHCPLARFIWGIVRDLMRIMIGTKRRIDEKAAMINYYTLEKNMNKKKNRKYCNTLMVVARRIIYTLYYKEDKKDPKSFK